LVVRSVQKVNRKYINTVVKKALSEDLFPKGDLTTNLLASKKKIIKNNVIAEIKAKTKTILIAERTALNFLNHASGISTLTNKFVDKVGKKTKICCTRKTTPNLRLLEKYAVRKGGGYNHRFNLSDEILIKENHINSSSSIKNLIYQAIKTRNLNLKEYFLII